MTRPIIIYFALLAALASLLPGCSAASNPNLIASAPKAATPIARYPASPDMHYQSEIWLQVGDVGYTSKIIAQYTVQLGGYVSSSTNWYTDGGQAVTLELAVPGSGYERLRAYILATGQVIEEHSNGTHDAPGKPLDITQYSTINLHLLPSTPVSWAPPPVQPSGWDPVRTFQQAFAVFMTIFGFLVNILIWSLVVIGPFVLMGLGLYWLVRRMRRKPASPPNPDA